MVAMTPLITIQILGLVSRFKSKQEELPIAAAVSELDQLPDDIIIEL